MTTGAVADAANHSWVEQIAPYWSRPYLRLMRADRPIGFWLLFWPCAWSLTLASMERGDGWLNIWFLKSLLAFFIGAVVMRGAGCVWNDITDRHIDAEVARTKSRPIPSGQVSVATAAWFMAALGLIGLVALMQFNQFTVGLGLFSLVIVGIYPFMKRVTSWPQAVLGLAFGWGALMGWSARFAAIELPSLLLYAATIFWIIAYDTIYAHQDREDDAIIGMKSTALRFGAKTKNWLSIFYSMALILIFSAVLVAGGEGGLVSPAYAQSTIGVMVLGLGLAAGLLLWQIVTLDINDGENCLDRFRHNHIVGLTVFSTLLLMWLAQSIAIGRTYWTPWF